MGKQQVTKCPECGENVEAEAYDEVGEVISCYHCDAELEIIKINPLKVQIVTNDIFSLDEDFNDFRDTEGLSVDYDY